MWGDVEFGTGRHSSFVTSLLTPIQNVGNLGLDTFFTVQFCDCRTVLSCKEVLASACLEDHSRGPS